uniref:Uncharacterized protein n=1 Tax=viral metagenome TaxID=1070528 RepID=A0A6M3LCL9_9ZZZZ
MGDAEDDLDWSGMFEFPEISNRGIKLNIEARKALERKIKRNKAYLEGSWSLIERTKKMKMQKKYYVGSEAISINEKYMGTLEEAIEKAKDWVSANGRERYIVKVVKVVKPASRPIIVESVD